MRRPKIHVLGLMVVLALIMSACGGNGGTAATTNATTTTVASTEATTTTATGQPLKVALVLPGSASDKGFNQLAYEALGDLQQKFGAETAYTEMTPVPEFVKAFEDYASAGYDIVIGQGFEFGEIAQEVAPDYPDTIFLVTNNNDLSGPNMQGLQPASQQAAYLAGVVAGMASDSGKVGGIAGFEFPVIVAQMEAFRLGAQSVDPNIDVTITYLGTFDDVEKAKETARAMISGGVDVVYHIADAAGVGVIQAAGEEGVYAIGWGADQYDIAPQAVITSQIVDQRVMIVEAVGDIVDGNFTGQQRFFGLDTPVLGLAPIRAVDDTLAAEIQTRIDDVKAQIMDGSLEVPFITEPQS
jgi:basic membrane protein A